MSFLGKLFSKGTQRSIGIDFGSSELKAVQFTATSRGPVLEHVYKVSTPANSIKDGVVTDPPLVGEALRQLVTEGAFTAKRTISAVAGPTVVVRQVTMPAMRTTITQHQTRALPKKSLLPLSSGVARVQSGPDNEITLVFRNRPA